MAATQEALEDAARALEGGGVVAVPTDTVYGLAARLDRPRALQAIFTLKGRPPALALPVLVAGPEQLSLVVAAWPAAAATLAGAFWPGALTLVVPARPEVGPLLGGDGATVGVRQPHRGDLAGLLSSTGPLAVTSANRHGSPPCSTAEQVRRDFPAPGAPQGDSLGVAVVVDGGRCDGTPSTVVDCTAHPPTCRREGGVSWAQVCRSLAG